MKIRVTTDKYEYQGLKEGSIHKNASDSWCSGDYRGITFTANGKIWYLTDPMFEVVEEDEDDFPASNEKLLDVINTDLKQDSVLDIQHGGSHYKDKKIQPIEYITANNLDFCEGNIVKYASRHKEKNGAEDIRKVIHYAQFILKFEYGEEI